MKTMDFKNILKRYNQKSVFGEVSLTLESMILCILNGTIATFHNI